MTALVGHIDHLYEIKSGRSLTFGTLKSIIRLLCSGRMPASEKVDGYSLHVSFIDGQAVMARSKADIKNGGIGTRETRSRFISTEPKFVESVESVLESLTICFQHLPFELQEMVFGPDESANYNWYAIEIVDSNFPNVIQYQKIDNGIILLPYEHYKFCHLKGTELYNLGGSLQYAEIFHRINEFNEVLKGRSRFTLHSFPIGYVESRTATNPKKYLNDLVYIQENAGMKDSDTLEAYVYKRAVERYGQRISLRKDDILNGSKIIIPTQQGDRTAVQIRDEALRPVEMLLRKFAVEFLDGCESRLNIDQAEANEHMNQKAKIMVNLVKDRLASDPDLYQNSDVLRTFQEHYTKIIGKVPAIEGYVFDYHGQKLKITGNFAPINQIAGIIRKKNLSSLLVDVEESKLTNIFVPGGFKPPHRGHWRMIEVADSLHAGDIWIVIGSDVRDFITPEQSEIIWKLIISDSPIKDSSKIHILKMGKPEDPFGIIDVRSPVKYIYKYAAEAAQMGERIVIVGSEKDNPKERFGKIDKYAKPGIHVDVVSVKMIDDISAFQMRDYISKGERENFYSGLPVFLKKETREEIWKILTESDYVKRDIGNEIDKMLMESSFGKSFDVNFVKGLF